MNPTRGLAGLLLVLALAGQAIGAPALAKTAGSTADHGRFKELQGPFASGEEVTAACLRCHTEAARQVMATRHWTWDYVNPVTGQRLGKKTMLNSFCIADRSNEAFCNACHVGYGWKDDSFDFTSERNVDCLACHNTGAYAKIPGLAGHPPYVRMEYPPKSGQFVEAVDLAAVAARVGPSSRATCGACHFYGGGGDGVKHSDLDSSLVQPPRALDVHMAAEGANFTCATCHQTEGHRVAGSRVAPTSADPHGPLVRGARSGRNPATCQACHGERPHAEGPGAGLAGSIGSGSRRNDHASTLACQGCHIPAFARGGVPTKMAWDWSTAGTLDSAGKPFVRRDARGHVVFDSKKGDFVLGENVVPDYIWFDGRVEYTLVADRIDPAAIVPINRFGGNRRDPAARIWPVKRFRGKQPYDLEYLTLLVPHTAIPDDTALWFNFDWDKALKAGTAAAGQPFSGKYGFVATEMLWPITHMVAPKEDALACAACHARAGRLRNVAGVYLPGRDAAAWLDRAGFGLAALALLGVFGHGALRLLTRGRRKEEKR